MNRILAGLGIIFFCFSGCEKSNNSVEPPAAVPFDLSLGKTWTYARSWVLSDSTGNILHSETDSFQVRIASIYDTLNNYKELIRFEAQSIPHFAGLTKVWYKFAGDSLVEIAYKNAGATPVILPKQRANAASGIKKGPPLFSLFPQSLVALMKLKGFEDSVIFRDDIRIVYKFPLENGDKWTSFRFPILQEREVVGTETIGRAGKNFSCAKIKTTIPTMDPSIEWYDYVSKEGLIERQIRIVLEMTTMTNPDGTGEKELSTEILTLISN